MLRISRRTDYAVRVMIAVAQEPYGTYLPAPRIGREMVIPHPFLVKVVGDLKRGGLIATATGRNGGVALARPAGTITLRHIVEAVEGPIVVHPCLVRAGECPLDDLCTAHPVWERLQLVLQTELEAVSLASLAHSGSKPVMDSRDG